MVGRVAAPWRWTGIVRSIALAAGLVVYISPPAIAAPTVTCDWTATGHKVKVSISGTGDTRVARSASGRINVNGIWCDGIATVTNTDKITVLAGAGDQSLTLYLDNGGFQPGFTPEIGDSQEIEISVSLGGGASDTLRVFGSSGADHVIAGKSSGFGAIGRINLNTDELDGIDADLTLIVGIEFVRLFGFNGADAISAAGGGGTGAAAEFSVQIVGGDGPDVLTGGAAHDYVIGGGGGDVLKGGAGPDTLDAKDASRATTPSTAERVTTRVRQIPKT